MCTKILFCSNYCHFNSFSALKTNTESRKVSFVSRNFFLDPLHIEKNHWNWRRSRTTKKKQFSNNFSQVASCVVCFNIFFYMCFILFLKSKRKLSSLNTLKSCRLISSRRKSFLVSVFYMWNVKQLSQHVWSNFHPKKAPTHSQLTNNIESVR